MAVECFHGTKNVHFIFEKKKPGSVVDKRLKCLI